MTEQQQIQYLRIGIITGAHGLMGRLKVSILTDVLERFAPDSIIYIGSESVNRPCRVTEFIPGRGRSCFLHLQGVDNRNQAEELKGCFLFIDQAVAERTRDLLDDDSYYYYDIIGCDVWRDRDLYGIVTGIIQAGAGEILIIEDRSGKKHMVPFVASMVDTSAIGQRKLLITPIEGLLED